MQGICHYSHTHTYTHIPSHKHTDNPCLLWTSFYPAQAQGIFRWPGQAREASFWGQRSEKCPSWPWRIQAPYSSDSRLPLLHYEVRGLERSQGGWYNTEHCFVELLDVIFLFIIQLQCKKQVTFGLMAMLQQWKQTEWPTDSPLIRQHKLFISLIVIIGAGGHKHSVQMI